MGSSTAAWANQSGTVWLANVEQSDTLACGNGRSPELAARDQSAFGRHIPMQNNKDPAEDFVGLILVQIYQILVRFVIYKSTEVLDMLEDINQLKESNI